MTYDQDDKAGDRAGGSPGGRPADPSTGGRGGGFGRDAGGAFSAEAEDPSMIRWVRGSGASRRGLASAAGPVAVIAWTDDNAAAWLYEQAPFAMLAHDTASDPLFVYANRTAPSS